MKKILVIGSINVDIVFNTERLPQKGETIFSDSFITHFGGKGANQAFTAARLGGDVTLMGVVGNDAYGKSSLTHLKENGNVNIDHIAVSQNKPTGLANIVVAKNGDNQIIVNSGANFDFSAEYIETIKTAIDQHDLIIFQLEIPLAVVEELVNYARLQDKIIILNPAPAQTLSDQLLSQVDYLVPNETELGLLADEVLEDELAATAAGNRLIKKHEIPHLIVTLGEIGAYYMTADETHKIPSQKVEAIDTTCAGDSYIGAFALKLSQGESIIDALTFATKVSAIVVTREGAQTSIPTLEEVNRKN